MAMVVRQCFESAVQLHLFPRSQIDIYLQVLQSDGGMLAACINAATLALIDAGESGVGLLAMSWSRSSHTHVIIINFFNSSFVKGLLFLFLLLFMIS